MLGDRATAVPCALRTSLASCPTWRGAVRDGVLHLDDAPLSIGRLVDVTVPPLARPGAGRAPIDVAGLVGRGDGLTPYGDDVLCGWLAVHRAAGIATPEVDAEVRAHLPRTTLLSATLLDCAMHGEVIPEFAAYVAALGRRRRPADALAAVGPLVGPRSARGGAARPGLAGEGGRMTSAGHEPRRAPTAARTPTR